MVWGVYIILVGWGNIFVFKIWKFWGGGGGGGGSVVKFPPSWAKKILQVPLSNCALGHISVNMQAMT